MEYQLYNDTIHVYDEFLPVASNGDADYSPLFEEYDLCDLVENGNVDEVWIWAGNGDGVTLGNMHEWEISGPGWSNTVVGTYRTPNCGRILVTMVYNFTREPALALHSYGHRMETVMRHYQPCDMSTKNWPWNGAVYHNDCGDLLSNAYGFVARPYSDNGQVGGCGDVHHPPNISQAINQDYIYNEGSTANTICPDWNMDGSSEITNLNCQAWGCTEYGYQIWWMQNFPGYNNTNLNRDGETQPNWWAYQFNDLVNPVTQTPTSTQTSTPTQTATNVPSNTPTSTQTSTPTQTATQIPTDTPTSTQTNTPTQTATQIPTDTPTNTQTSTPTQTTTKVPTDTPTSTQTSTPTLTATATTPIVTVTTTPIINHTETPTAPTSNLDNSIYLPLINAETASPQLTQIDNAHHIATFKDERSLSFKEMEASIERNMNSLNQIASTQEAIIKPVVFVIHLPKYENNGGAIEEILTLNAQVIAGLREATVYHGYKFTPYLEAYFLGQDGESYAGAGCTEGDTADNVHIRIRGLKPNVAPTKYRVDDTAGGGVWATPCNPISNWQLHSIEQDSGDVDLYFKPFRVAPDNTQYSVTVTYEDGSTQFVALTGTAVTP
ncbi:MAG: hypothetical protein AB8G95_06230 [Anaerolineae bacterium]